MHDHSLTEPQACVALNNISGIGVAKAHRLLRRFGSAQAVLSAKPEEIASLPGFGDTLAKAIATASTNDLWKRDWERVEHSGTTLIPCTDPRYPQRLLEIPDHPLLLYVQGSIIPQDGHSIALVGTRAASIYGMEAAEQFGNLLASYGFTVVSGLARGIDTAGHLGALNSGRTLAVIGSGLNCLYPKENSSLAKKIAERGAVISEYPMNTPPSRQTFPQRNRIVSGMTLGTLLIEAPLRSGAMITMRLAHAQGRRLFALPGRVDNPNFAGNHLLIKQQIASLVDHPQEIAQTFSALPLSSPPSSQRSLSTPLNSEEQRLLDALPCEEVSIDDIVQIADLPIAKLNVLLMSLVLKQRLREYPGKIYKSI